MAIKQPFSKKFLLPPVKVSERYLPVGSQRIIVTKRPTVINRPQPQQNVIKGKVYHVQYNPQRSNTIAEGRSIVNVGKLRFALTYYQTTNFSLFQTERFADDNFKFDENRSKLSKLVENTVGNGEIARYEQFLLFPQCFQKACFPGASKGVIVWEWVTTDNVLLCVNVSKPVVFFSPYCHFLLATLEAFVDSADQDKTAQNVWSDLSLFKKANFLYLFLRELEPRIHQAQSFGFDRVAQWLAHLIPNLIYY